MIELRLFGSAELRTDGGADPAAILAHPKRLALLAYLAAGRPFGFHQRDALVALLWPELDQEHARGALRQTLHRLRQSVGKRLIVARGDEALGLDATVLWCDVRAFDEALGQNCPEGALALYRGDFLPAVFDARAPGFERWIEGERYNLRLCATRAAWLASDQAEQAGDTTRRTEWAQRAVRLAPDDERGARRLIELLERVGDRAGASRVCNELERYLTTELEVAPSGDTAALFVRIRGNGAPAAAFNASFVAPTAQRVVAKQLVDPAPPTRTARSSVPPPLEAAVLSAPGKSPLKRVVSVAAFVAGLDRKSVVVAPPAPPPHENLEEGRSKRKRQVYLLWTVLVAVGIAATTHAARSWFTGSPDDASIAVLPIENVGSDSANQYSAVGMSDELSGALKVVRGLRVVPPASAAYFLKGQAPDYRALGEALHVKAVLTGTSLRLANHLRITMVLINASDRTIMWTDTLSRELRTADDLFGVRDAIVAAIVEKLRIRLEPNAAALPKARPTESLDAATAYIQGRYLLASNRGPANMAKAMTFFQRAIALDSLYAAAYSGLADVYAVYGAGNMADYNPNEFLPLARQTAEKALSLDPSLAEAHVSLGWARMLYDFDWSGAEAELTRGIQLDSGYSLAYGHRASLYQMLGRFDRALADGQTAARRDPVNMQSRYTEGRGYLVSKQYEQATISLQQAADLNATDYFIRMVLGQAFEQRKMFDSALFELRTAISLNPRSSRPRALLVHALASAGDTAAAIAELHLLEERLKVGYVPALDFAIAYAGLGDLPQTFLWLNRACDDHSIRPYLMDPGFDRIRSDPRYGVLMRRLHLPA